MSRSILIMVSDSAESVETTRRTYQGSTDITLHVYSSSQWREGLESPFFRQQLTQGVPSLAFGSGPVRNEEGKVLAFPTASAPEPQVFRMDDLEAKAIDNAIQQYKGNLTEAAKALGIGRATLYRKVKQYHLDPSSARKKRIAA